MDMNYKYYSYNFRSGGFHMYTQEQFEEAKRFYRLIKKVLWGDGQEDTRIVWVNKGETIMFGELNDEKKV